MRYNCLAAGVVFFLLWVSCTKPEKGETPPQKTEEGTTVITPKSLDDALSDHTGNELIGEVLDPLDLYGSLPEGVTNVALSNSLSAGLGQMETSNCYVINEAGRYAFPADVRGNGVSVSGLSLEIPGAVSAGIVWDEGSILKEVTLYTDTKGRPWIVAETPSDFARGNALVAVKDATDKILWSWHIWGSSYSPGEGDRTIGSASNGCWAIMPVELGMMTADDPSCTLYQWGRKDPFPCVTPANTTSSPMTLEESFSRPDCFYAQNTSMYCSDGNYGLWNPYNSPTSTGKTMLDPCPPGYFVMPYSAAQLMLKYGVESCTASSSITLGSGITMHWHPILFSAAVNSNYHFYWQHSYWQDGVAEGRKGSALVNKDGSSWSADNNGGAGFGFPVKAVRNGKYKAAFMGDSITAIWGGYKENDSDEDKRGDSRFFVSHAFLNKGISGQTTSQMLARFDNDIVAQHPEKVVILAGINDLAGNDNGGTPRSADHIIGNLSAMAQKALDGGVREVFLCSVLPVNQYGWRPSVEPMPLIQELNAKIKTYCDATPGCTYVDYYSAWINKEGTGAKDGLTYDEVHPTKAGCAVLESIIMTYLQ